MNIFNHEAFEAAVAQVSSAAGRADAIAYRLKKTATEKMEEDPAFSRKFSEMIEETIEAYKQGRMDELEYLNQMEGALEQFRLGRDSSLPPQLANYQDASAYYGLLVEALSRFNFDGNNGDLASYIADVAIQFEQSINRHKIRDWGHNPDVVNRIMNTLED